MMRPSAQKFGLVQLLCLAGALVACSAGADPASSPASGAPGPTASAAPAAPAAATPSPSPELVGWSENLPPLRLEATSRTIAIGDVHGDLDALMATLRMARLVDEEGRWSGGDTTLVQVGDQLDRGDDEQAILDLLEVLREQAEAVGGRVIALLGNHEIMNVAGDFRYVTEGGWFDFNDVEGLDLTDPRLAALPEPQRPRAAAFLPGGVYAQLLADHPVIQIVGDTMFVHGGVLPQHVAFGLERINQETSAWLLGGGAQPPVMRGERSPIWARAWSRGEPDCGGLEQVLSAAEVNRIVVAHTVQREGINSVCDGQAWRVDVGLAAHYGGSPQALELANGQARVIRPD